MRVLHINRNYITTALHQVMINHLDKFEIENLIFVPHNNAYIMVIFPIKNVIIRECFKDVDRLFFNLKQKKIQASLEKSINVSEFDCIHAYTLFTDGNCAMNLSKKYNIPYVVAIRSTDVNDFFRKMPFLINRGIEIMKNASAIFFLSKSYKDQVLNKYVPNKYRKEFERKTYIIPNGIDDFWISNIPKETKDMHSPIRLIYVGRIDYNKNIELTQSVVDKLNSKGMSCVLYVVGRPYNKRIYNNLLKDPNIICNEWLPKEELIKFYTQSDIFVMPSHKETFGLVYAEAMSQGLPVIYTRGQGFDKQFEDGMVGYSISDTSPKELEEKIIDIVSNYSELSKNCMEMSKKFEWDKICELYYKIYKKIVS